MCRNNSMNVSNARWGGGGFIILRIDHLSLSLSPCPSRSLEARVAHLRKREAGFLVGVEYLLDSIHIGGRTQVEAQVVLGSRSHDLLFE